MGDLLTSETPGGATRTAHTNVQDGRICNGDCCVRKTCPSFNVVLERLALRFGQNQVIQFQFVLNVTVIYRHVIGKKKICDTFFGMHNLSQLGVGGGGTPPQKQTHIGNNLLKIVVLLYNFIIIYLYNIGAQNSWFFLEAT